MADLNLLCFWQWVCWCGLAVASFSVKVTSYSGNNSKRRDYTKGMWIKKETEKKKSWMNKWTACWKASEIFLKEPETQKMDCISRNKRKKVTSWNLVLLFKFKTPTDIHHGGFENWCQWHHLEVETHRTHKQTGLRGRDKLSTHTPHVTTCIHCTTHTHTHSLSLSLQRYGARSDNRQVDLAWSNWRDPKKAKQTHERAGAFVFVECHTSSRGKPITGPGRSLKLWEGCVGIASVATSDVNFNILIAGYFLD